MIETTIPEIDVSDLMARVRTKVEQTRQIHPRPKLPELPVLADGPPTILPNPVTPPHDKILGALQGAREATTVSRWIPKPLRGLFRRQGTFNRDVLRAIESLARTDAQLADRLRHLTACVEVQDHAIRHLTDLRRADGQWMQEVARVHSEDGAWIRRAEHIFSSMSKHRREVLSSTKAVAEKINAIEEKNLATIANLLEELGRFRAQVEKESGRVDDVARRAEEVAQKIGAIDQQTAAAEQRMGALVEQVTTFGQQLDEAIRGLRSEVDNSNEKIRNLEAIGQDSKIGEQLKAADSAFIKAELSQHSELIHKLANHLSTPRRAGGKRTPNGELSEAAAHRLDAFYFGFENRFRGPRDEIKRRSSFYLPFLEKCRAGTKTRPIVDLGCGRGEWLELLREQKLTASGVDFNKTMIDQCKQRKLKAVQGDALEFLRGLSDNSQGAVTGFHIIEHLSFETLIDLISETFRVIQPGGLALFESPNCKNLSVGACYFYMDPTHRHPIFPETALFILENKGFERVTLEYLCPMEISDMAELETVPTYLRDLLYGPRDFGVIGYKPIAH